MTTYHWSKTPNALIAILLETSIPLFAEGKGWNPVKDVTLDGKPLKGLPINGGPVRHKKQQE
ncbi:MAG: hypothetical protein NTU53_00645 [Planctomycetota bacterium]|nr:hypothetical protein [Planctomycetota bacterium]